MLAVLKKDVKELDRSIAEPLIMDAYHRSDGFNRQTIRDVIDDINYSLHLNI